MKRYENDLAGLLEEAEAQAAHGKDWLRPLREQAIAVHREHGFPTPKNEEWKYTPLRDVASRDWRRAEPGQAVFDKELPWATDGAKVVLVNGRLAGAAVVGVGVDRLVEDHRDGGVAGLDPLGQGGVSLLES